jgi:propanol-preferring alcohol dehydrogenase
MKAWHFTNTNEPLVQVELPDPVPGPGEVVINTKACGLCHTDVGVLEDEGWLSTLRYRPIVIGHEVAGEVAALGEGVTGWQVGDRVGICPTTEVGAPGFNYDGGFGEKVKVWAGALVKIPDNVSYALGAAGTDAGMTSHAAVISIGQVKAGDKVGIIGFGGLGQIGTRVAVLTGADVYVAEVNEKVWDNAKASGAKGVGKSIAEFGDDFDVIVDYAGFGTTTAESIENVRMEGRVVQVGMGRLEANISTKWLILKKVTLVGSNGGTIADVEGCYDYFATGQIDPVITEIGFEDIPAGLEKLAKGEVVGRLVVMYP